MFKTKIKIKNKENKCFTQPYTPFVLFWLHKLYCKTNYNTERLKVSSPTPGLKAKNINNKSTFIWLLHYTASRVYPVSTFPYLILKMRKKIKEHNENNTNNSKEKRQLERGVKTEGLKTPACVCVRLVVLLLQQSSLEACSAPTLKDV